MRRISAVVTLLFLTWPPFVLRAQSTNASLSGRISDPTNAAITDARVVAISTSTNIRYETTSNASGEYYLTNLPPGSYTLEVEKAGFKKLVKPDVVLHVQDALAEQGERHGGSGRTAREHIRCDGQHTDQPQVRRGPSSEWPEFPDPNYADTRRGGDADGLRRSGPVQR